MLIALHNLATQHSNLVTSIRIARETGYAGIEIGGPKLKHYLAQGFTLESLRPLLKDVPPVGLSYVQDIERQESTQYDALLQECATICALAAGASKHWPVMLPGPTRLQVEASRFARRYARRRRIFFACSAFRRS